MASSTGIDSQIDQEWTKFMMKLNKQGDCDNSDEDEEEEDAEEVFDITNVKFAAHRAASNSSSTNKVGKQPGSDDHNNTTKATAGGGVGKAVAPKRTCISKKQQRKTYSFLYVRSLRARRLRSRRLRP